MAKGGRDDDEKWTQSDEEMFSRIFRINLDFILAEQDEKALDPSTKDERTLANKIASLTERGKKHREMVSKLSKCEVCERPVIIKSLREDFDELRMQLKQQKETLINRRQALEGKHLFHLWMESWGPIMEAIDLLIEELNTPEYLPMEDSEADRMEISDDEEVEEIPQEVAHEEEDDDEEVEETPQEAALDKEHDEDLPDPFSQEEQQTNATTTVPQEEPVVVLMLGANSNHAGMFDL